VVHLSHGSLLIIEKFMLNNLNYELENLFLKFNVPKDISFLAKVQTLISKHDCNPDYIKRLYNFTKDL
jgi:hypothetical protein